MPHLEQQLCIDPCTKPAVWEFICSFVIPWCLSVNYNVFVITIYIPCLYLNSFCLFCVSPLYSNSHGISHSLPLFLTLKFIQPNMACIFWILPPSLGYYLLFFCGTTFCLIIWCILCWLIPHFNMWHLHGGFDIHHLFYWTHLWFNFYFLICWCLFYHIPPHFNLLQLCSGLNLCSNMIHTELLHILLQKYVNIYSNLYSLLLFQYPIHIFEAYIHKNCCHYRCDGGYSQYLNINIWKVVKYCGFHGKYELFFVCYLSLIKK